MNLTSTISSWLSRGKPTTGGLTHTFATRALDDKRDTGIGDSRGYDRPPGDRADQLRNCLEAWRTNPLARRIVSTTTAYVIGTGLQLSSSHKETAAWLRQWANHPHNNLDHQLPSWCDELFRTGDLFVALHTDDSGLTVVRAVPSPSIQSIACLQGDPEHETSITQQPENAGAPPTVWPAYDALADPGPPWQPAMIHAAVNRPLGAHFGESDLAPLLRWLSRYSSWLEDRARLNRYRQSFLYWVRKPFANDAERVSMESRLNSSPPAPGSFLVTDEAENWTVLHPKLDSFEAAEDGLSIKKMICAGAGLPLHFLAEPESSTRTTAEQAGGPTFRVLQARQTAFLHAVRAVAVAAATRRAVIDHRTAPDTIRITAPDLNPRDNATLAQAASYLSPALLPMVRAGGITVAEFIRMVYSFAGEPAPERLDGKKEVAPHDDTPNPPDDTDSDR